MSEVTLVKQLPLDLTEAESAAMRKVLFEAIGGLNAQDKSAWNRFWAGIRRAEVGQIFAIETWFPRHGKFHRLHMRMEAAVFDAQERIATFDQFRVWLKIGAGFVDWLPGPKGGVVPIPRSISYRKADEETFQQFHADAIAFLRTPYAQKTLWPRLTYAQRAEMLEIAIAGFV